MNSVIRADFGKVFRRIHDGAVMGSEIALGIDYSTGAPRPDLAEYYDEIPDTLTAAFPISKIKIGDAFEKLGMIDAFEAFVASDKTCTRRWRDAVVLMSDDPMVVEACKYFQSTGVVTAAQIGELLQSCKSDIG